jgi:hypothetical protein
LFENKQPGLSLYDAISDLPPPSLDSDRTLYIKEPQNDYQRSFRRKDGAPIAHHIIKNVNAATYQRIQHLTPGETMKHLPEELQHPILTKVLSELEERIYVYTCLR